MDQENDMIAELDKYWKQDSFLQHDICTGAKDKGIMWSRGMPSLIPEKAQREPETYTMS